MDRKEIMDILPHRNSMLLLDEVQESGGVAVGHYRVRGDEFFLMDISGKSGCAGRDFVRNTCPVRVCTHENGYDRRKASGIHRT